MHPLKNPKILLVFAHPDDETFSSGGTLIKYSKQGAEISLITATFGQAGQTGPYGDISAEEVGKIREQELNRAAEIMGIKKIHHFGLMDGELYKYRVSTLADKVLPLMEVEAPDVVITFEKKGGSNHPDHIKMSYVATHAFREYMKNVKKNVRLYHTVTPRSFYVQYEKMGLANTGFGTPKGVYDSHITTKIDIEDVFDLKLKALACHKTQEKDVERYITRAQHVDLKKEYFKLIAENGMF